MATDQRPHCHRHLLGSITYAENQRPGEISTMRHGSMIAAILAASGMLLGLVPIAATSSSAATPDRGRNVTVENDGTYPWRACDHTCTRDIEVTARGTKDVYRQRIYARNSFDLGRVESFDLSESFHYSDRSVYTMNYSVRVSSSSFDDSTIRLIVRELHNGPIPSGLYASVYCTEWRPSTGSDKSSCAPRP
jgi:hypothetical protein